MSSDPVGIRISISLRVFGISVLALLRGNHSSREQGQHILRGISMKEPRGLSSPALVQSSGAVLSILTSLLDSDRKNMTISCKIPAIIMGVLG